MMSINDYATCVIEFFNLELPTKLTVSSTDGREFVHVRIPDDTPIGGFLKVPIKNNSEKHPTQIITIESNNSNVKSVKFD